MGKGSSDVAVFCAFFINPIKNTSSRCLVASLIEKERGATSGGTFNQKLGYLHVTAARFDQGNRLFERKNIYSGGSRGGACPPPPPIFLSQTEVRRAEKKILRPGPPLS